MLPVADHVTNPTTGASLAVYLSKPDGEGPFPALVVVPGGINPAARAMHPVDREIYKASGIALVLFDPDGRGQSTGSEDYNGEASQDGLPAVVDWARRQPSIAPDRIGILCESYGITLAAGALARHPDMPVKFLIDFEGPSDRTVTAGCGGHPMPPHGAIRFGACDDDAWWAHREANKAIGKVKVPYQRIQFTRDHAQPDYTHTVRMVSAALAGDVPWVRLNHEAPGRAVRSDADVVPIPNSAGRHAVIAEFARDLFDRFAPGPSYLDERALEAAIAEVARIRAERGSGHAGPRRRRQPAP